MMSDISLQQARRAADEKKLRKGVVGVRLPCATMKKRLAISLPPKLFFIKYSLQASEKAAQVGKAIKAASEVGIQSYKSLLP